MKKRADIVEFTLIYNEHKVHIFHFVRKMINNEMAAEDITQSVFMKFFENMPDIRDKNSHEFWLFKTARNEIYNFYRSKKAANKVYEYVDAEPVEIPAEEGIEDRFDSIEMHNLIIKELNSFPVEQREPYLLKEYSGLTYKEISELLGFDEDLVRSRLFKVRRKLIERISKIMFYGVK